MVEESVHLHQRTKQHKRGPPLLWVEIGIARAHGQPVRLAHDGTDDDLNRKVEVAHHAADDRRLSRVLLPEESDIRLHYVEEFRDKSGHYTEVAGEGHDAKFIAQD